MASPDAYEELGCDSHPIKLDGQPARVIRVFDLRSGGYTTQAAERLNESSLWRRVIDRLDRCNCSHACQRCLLSFDTRFEADRLNRHAALAWINQAWLAGLALPSELAVFGARSKAEITSLQEAVERELTRDDTRKTVAVYLPASPENWDLAIARRLRHQLQSWEMAGHQPQLHLQGSTFAALERDQKDALGRLASGGVEICVHEDALPDLGALALNITVHGPQGSWAWASDNPALLAPDHRWDLAATGARIIRGSLPAPLASRTLQASDLMPLPTPGVIKIEIASQLDGSNTSFAKRFWEHLRNEAGVLLEDALAGKDPIIELTYSDRYVRNPLVVNLLVNVIRELARSSNDVFAIRIIGGQYQKEDHRPPWQCRHDWQTFKERDDGIRQALEYCALQGEVSSLPSLPHYRQLQLQLRSGKRLIIQFDQGLSYWRVEVGERSNLLRFDFSSRQLGVELMDRNQCNIVAGGDECTQIFISMV